MAREEEEDAAAAPPAATAPVPETSEANSCGSVLGGGESTSMVAGGLCGRRAAGSLEDMAGRYSERAKTDGSEHYFGGRGCCEIENDDVRQIRHSRKRRKCL